MAILGAWEAGARASSSFAFLASSPIRVAVAWYALLVRGELVAATGVSLLETMVGLVAGTLIGATVGLGLWFSRTVAAIAKPYVIAFSAVPLFVFAPVLILSLGVGMALKLFVASVGTTFIALSQAYIGAQSVGQRMFEEARGLGASKRRVFRLVVVPGSLDWVLNSIRLNVGAALLGAFIGEFITSQSGLGYLVIRESGLYDVSGALAAGGTIVVLALSLNGAASLLERNRAKLIQLIAVGRAVRAR